MIMYNNLLVVAFNNLLITGAIGCGKTSLIKLQRNII